MVEIDRWEFWDEHFKDYYKDNTHVEPRDDLLDEIRLYRNYILFIVNWNLEIADELLDTRFLEYNPDIQTIDDLKKIIDTALERNDDLEKKISSYMNDCAKKCIRIIFDSCNISYRKERS